MRPTLPLALPVRLSIAVITLCFAVACKDDRPARSHSLTAPERPGLTLKTLPKDAPTICVASVGHRDRLLAIKNPTAATARDLNSLNAVIDDVCQ
jgi:hypothetical protein